METAVLTQLLPPHLNKYATITERHVLLCAGRIIKYSQRVSDSLFLPRYSIASYFPLRCWGRNVDQLEFVLNAFLGIGVSIIDFIFCLSVLGGL